jgi:hypothetical protein
MLKLTPKEEAIIRKVLLSDAIKYLIGAENWDLTVSEEKKLWAIIERLRNSEKGI